MPASRKRIFSNSHSRRRHGTHELGAVRGVTWYSTIGLTVIFSKIQSRKALETIGSFATMCLSEAVSPTHQPNKASSINNATRSQRALLVRFVKSRQQSHVPSKTAPKVHKNYSLPDKKGPKYSHSFAILFACWNYGTYHKVPQFCLLSYRSTN